MNPAGELVKKIIQSSPETNIELPAQWLETLGKFRNVLEEPTKPFLQLEFATRKQLVDTIVKRLRESKSSEEVIILAAIVRILARETGDDLASICNNDFVSFCWAFAGYNAVDENSGFTQTAKAEVGKCLVNIFFKMPSALELALKEQKHFRLLEKIKAMDPLVDFTCEYAFPVLRLLFLFARPIESSTVYREFAKNGAITLMFSFIRAWMTIEGKTENPVVLTSIKECLQVIFSSTLDMGSLAKGSQMNYEECIPNYKEDMEIMIDVICMNSTSLKEQMNELKMSAINACVNIPSVFTPVLLTLGDKEAVLKNLFDLLDDEMSIMDENKKNFLPLFIILKNLLGSIPDIRPYGMKRLFPDRNLESEKERNSDGKLCMDVPQSEIETTGNRIVKLLTSFHQAVQFTSNDLLFALVGEDPDKYIRLVGFGNAAGLLAMRNLFGMGANLQGDTLSQFKEFQKSEGEGGKKIEDITEEDKEAFFKSINAVEKDDDEENKPKLVQQKEKIDLSAQFKQPNMADMPDLIPEREGETDEDKEDRMVRNFEKLVDAGFIKLIKKEDGGPGEPDKK